ncbi:hypothetical protein [Xanthomonas arboricola]|uniref:hypothetical protein n=1 Tax=Xanthomonas arboricola TaxID=56448 RepID=UPI00161CCD52|nr:hypothetical protein [Xanthomonas arboricola]MBB3760798.1 Asp-tRNA(Asn)/Glu-tRNA(Gln) amidotransferase A subunit family amidase [Xanthomonas arboricola]
MRAFHVQGIVWDTGGKRAALPAEATVECEREAGIADALSDAYGWLVSEIAVVEEIDVGHCKESGQG